MNATSLSVIDRLRIFQVRGQAVVLDSDLAAIYGAATKVLNKGVRRNAARFSHDFLFHLTEKEFAALRFQIGTSKDEAARAAKIFDHGFPG